MIYGRTVRAFLLALGLIVAASAPALAQTTPAAVPAESATASSQPKAEPAPSPSPSPTTTPAIDPDSLRALVTTIEDPLAREAFIERLRTLIEASQAPASSDEREDWLASATRSISAFATSVVGLAGGLEQLPEQLVIVARSLSQPAMLERVAWTTITVLAALFAALLAEWLTKRLLRRLRNAIEARAASGLSIRLLLLLSRTLVDAVPIAMFAAAAFGTLSFVALEYLVQLAVITIVNANVVARLAMLAGRAVLSPEAPGLRIVPLGNESAAYGLLWVRRFTHIGIYGYFLLRTLWILGISTVAFEVLLGVLGFIIAGMAVVLVLQLRSGAAAAIRAIGTPTSSMARLRDQVADFWHLFAIAYLAVGFGIFLFDIGGGLFFFARASLVSLVILIAARLATKAILQGFAAVFRLNEELRGAYPLLEARANRYTPLLKRAVVGLVAIGTTLALIEVWGGSSFAWLASDEGEALLGSVIAIAIVLGAAFVAWELASAFAERMIARNPSSTRLRTLLPFLQNALRILIVGLTGLVVLSEIGVNIAPLLAGAGVLGLAVGFGAQTLVKDVITGVFILLEDTIAVGDVVELGSHSGLVEKITIRTVHLRDFDGNVHSIPFGDVQTVKNMTKHFAYAVVDVTVSYRENIDEALAVMAEVAAGMAAEGPLAEEIIAPFEVVGVEGLQDSAVWLRGRFKTRPLGQWNVRREFYRRIKAAFDAHGIEIPFPHQTIYFGVDKQGEAPPLRIRDEGWDEAPRPRRRRRTPTTKTTTGPRIEEHPGARERVRGTEAIETIDEDRPE